MIEIYSDMFEVLRDKMTVCCQMSPAVHLPSCSLMARWLEQASQWHEMYCHDLKVMSLNPGLAELGIHSTSVLSCT